jgi:hypothetical protein
MYIISSLRETPTGWAVGYHDGSKETVCDVPASAGVPELGSNAEALPLPAEGPPEEEAVATGEDYDDLEKLEALTAPDGEGYH